MRTGELYQRYYGVYLASVVDVDDPEQLGRVRVESDQFEDSDGSPVWANVARPASGTTSVFFTPKVGDQVILGYLVGDVNEPIILGYAHSKAKPKPDEVDTVKHGVVTSIGSVIFDEENKSITVTFNAGTTSSIVMNDDGITIEAPKLDINTTLAGQVCVNGDAVVLKHFLTQIYDQHVHPSGMGPTGMPVPPSTIDPKVSTQCT